MRSHVLAFTSRVGDAINNLVGGLVLTKLTRVGCHEVVGQTARLDRVTFGNDLTRTLRWV